MFCSSLGQGLQQGGPQTPVTSKEVLARLDSSSTLSPVYLSLLYFPLPISLILN